MTEASPSSAHPDQHSRGRRSHCWWKQGEQSRAASSWLQLHQEQLYQKLHLLVRALAGGGCSVLLSSSGGSSSCSCLCCTAPGRQREASARQLLSQCMGFGSSSRLLSTCSACPRIAAHDLLRGFVMKRHRAEGLQDSCQSLSTDAVIVNTLLYFLKKRKKVESPTSSSYYPLPRTFTQTNMALLCWQGDQISRLLL